MSLFPREQVVGIFSGFSEGGLEFHANLILPYRSEFQNSPMHGQFLLVQLENDKEGVLGRITSISAEGRLTSSTGEDYGLRAVAEDRPIPEDLREQYLKYRVNIRVLGVLREVGGKLVFAASHRRLPHVGSKVAFLSDQVLRYVANHSEEEGAELGYLALGEFIYGAGDSRLDVQDWMQIRQPTVIPRFKIQHLVSRRTFIFARAGFGKSNLTKLLFSLLYQETPTVEKRGQRRVPVGTVIFDPDGEYFWPDDKNRPGLCDVPHLADKLVVFTNRRGPSEFYQSFVASSIKIDIRRLRPADVISIALSPEKQDQQNVRKLKGLNDNDWRRLVDEIYQNGNAADGQLIKTILNLQENQDAEMVAARANMTTIVRMLHDPQSQMMDMLLEALRNGKLCVVDVSQMRGTPALILSGLILQKIFDHNQMEFTKAEPATIPTIAVIEEAQSVLNSSGSSAEGPYVAWVKEGRKYDLGAVMITQQPGSITSEILSQGDNWFVFHLLSAVDLQALKKANAHYSDDILSSLLNEPIPGHAVFWSSAGGKSYPIPIRIMSFERMYPLQDPKGTREPVETYAAQLREKFASALEASRLRSSPRESAPLFPEEDLRAPEGATEERLDALEVYMKAAIHKTRQDRELIERIREYGVTWKGVLEAIKANLPEILDNREKIAYDCVARFLNEVFGEGRWETVKKPSKNQQGALTTWVVVKR